MTTPNSFLTVTVGGSGSFTVNSACQNINAAFFVGGGSPGAPTISSGVGLSGNGYLIFNTNASGNVYSMSDNSPVVVGTAGSLTFNDRSSINSGLILTTYGTTTLGSATSGGGGTGSGLNNVSLTMNPSFSTLYVENGGVLQTTQSPSTTGHTNPPQYPYNNTWVWGDQNAIWGNVVVKNGGTVKLGDISTEGYSSLNVRSSTGGSDGSNGDVTFEAGSTFNIPVGFWTPYYNSWSVINSDHQITIQNGCTVHIRNEGNNTPNPGSGSIFNGPIIMHENYSPTYQPIGTFSTITQEGGPVNWEMGAADQVNILLEVVGS